jgi:NTE family protein
VRWENRTLMDGGRANNTPISHAVELGAERIYVRPTGHPCALQEPPRGALAVALHAISLLTQRRLIDDIERHRDAARLIVPRSPCPLDIQPIDFGHADELIGRALSDARELLDDGRALPLTRRPVAQHRPVMQHSGSNSVTPRAMRR